MRNAYSVGQVNRYIKNMFTQDYLMQKIYVKGEVSTICIGMAASMGAFLLSSGAKG